MGHGFDFIDLEHAQMRLPAMILEQRVMIGTEMARCAPTTNGGIEHATEAGPVDRTAVHSGSDDAAGELVHDHQHPVALEHDGLTLEEVDAPQAVCRLSDERQPRRPRAARRWTIVFRQDAVHDVLVDIDPERLRDDARNTRAPEPRIARLELDDGTDEGLARPGGPGFFGRWFVVARVSAVSDRASRAFCGCHKTGDRESNWTRRC